jgi:hypothetical protein
LDDEAEKIELEGVTAYVVDLEGTATETGMRGPFAGGGGGSLPGVAKPQAADAGGDVGVQFETPEGWKPGPPTGFSKASFVVTEGEQKASITVTDLAAGAGDLVDNINRWRGQVGLAPQGKAEIEKQLKSLPVSGKQGQYVVLEGPGKAGSPQTILGVIVEHSGQVWFVKLIGDAPLAAREQERFEAFAKSLKLGAE